jgi:hypothetical protein
MMMERSKFKFINNYMQDSRVPGLKDSRFLISKSRAK